ncbi:MAG: histidine kinase dimerization/phospho-acceptor domain-containing protein, partial [Ginsengibacter sp.]
MQRKGITAFILTAFITGTLLLVYIQYNSSKNIDKLIQGNEALMGEFKATNKLNELEKNIIAVESKLRGAVMMKGHSYVEGLNKDVSSIETNLQQLQQLSDDDSSVLYIDQLDILVKEKLVFTQQVLDTLFINGKDNAERLIATPYGKTLTEKIVNILHKLDSARKQNLAETTMVIDKSGEKAQRFSLTLIALVLVGGAGLFWYIINIIRKQLSLIHQLNISEKKVTESAQIKENFMANMSHEIRTPMNAILGFTHLLQRKQLDTEATEYV